MIRKLLTAVGAVALLAGCAHGSGGSGGPSLAQTVYTLEGVLTTAMDVAAQYAGLPTCQLGGPLVCSDPLMVSRIQAASTKAVTLVSRAQDAVTNGHTGAGDQNAAVTDAAVAVHSLTDLTSVVKTQ